MTPIIAIAATTSAAIAAELKLPDRTYHHKDTE